MCNAEQVKALKGEYFSSRKSQRITTAYGEGLLAHTASEYHSLKLCPMGLKLPNNWIFVLVCNINHHRTPTDLQINVVRTLYQIGCKDICFRFVEFPRDEFSVFRPEQFVSEGLWLNNRSAIPTWLRDRLDDVATKTEKVLRLQLLLSATTMSTPQQNAIVAKMEAIL